MRRLLKTCEKPGQGEPTKSSSTISLLNSTTNELNNNCYHHQHQDGKLCHHQQRLHHPYKQQQPQLADIHRPVRNSTPKAGGPAAGGVSIQGCDEKDSRRKPWWRGNNGHAAAAPNRFGEQAKDTTADVVEL
jgi:hypothetical protein